MPCESKTRCHCTTHQVTAFAAVTGHKTMHNRGHDLLASLLTEVSSSVRVKPALQPLDSKVFRCFSTTQDKSVPLDIQASGFWGGRLESKFFDARMFNLNVQSNLAFPVRSLYRHHEIQKCRKHEERVIEIEQATFTNGFQCGWWV